jgi:hypothetical protein
MAGPLGTFTAYARLSLKKSGVRQYCAAAKEEGPHSHIAGRDEAISFQVDAKVLAVGYRPTQAPPYLAGCRVTGVILPRWGSCGRAAPADGWRGDDGDLTFERATRLQMTRSGISPFPASAEHLLAQFECHQLR